MKYKNKLKIEFWVDQEDKINFFELCKKQAYSPTRLMRKLFEDKISKNLKIINGTK